MRVVVVVVVVQAAAPTHSGGQGAHMTAGILFLFQPQPVAANCNVSERVTAGLGTRLA